MSNLDAYFSDLMTGKMKGAKQDTAPIYTGAYERVAVQAEDNLNLRVFTHKGKIIAIAYGDRMLPFVMESVDPDQIATLQKVYRQGVAGLIDRIILRVPKR